MGSSGYHLHFLLRILTGRETNEKNEMVVTTLLFAEVRFPTKRGLVQFISLAYVVPSHEQKLCRFFQPKGDSFGTKNKVQILAQVTEMSLKRRI